MLTNSINDKNIEIKPIMYIKSMKTVFSRGLNSLFRAWIWIRLRKNVGRLNFVGEVRNNVWT